MPPLEPSGVDHHRVTAIAERTDLGAAPPGIEGVVAPFDLSDASHARPPSTEVDEFEVAVALHAAADHAAIEHAERGKQGGGAVPLVIVRHGLTAPRLDRQSGLSAVERLDL